VGCEEKCKTSKGRAIDGSAGRHRKRRNINGE